MKAHGSTILVLRMAVRVKVGFRSSGAVPDLLISLISPKHLSKRPAVGIPFSTTTGAFEEARSRLP